MSDEENEMWVPEEPFEESVTPRRNPEYGYPDHATYSGYDAIDDWGIDVDELGFLW